MVKENQNVMKIFRRYVMMLLLVPGFSVSVHAQLNAKQESIVPIAAHLATGEQESLKTALN
jgi:hypothetical protein